MPQGPRRASILPEPVDPHRLAVDGLRQAVEACGRCDGLMSDLQALYATIGQAVVAAGCQCSACGDCCNFPKYRHLLYVTGPELALLLRQPPGRPQAASMGLCPYQDGDACTARHSRPAACRTFFCARSAFRLSQEQAEQFHAALREAHQRHGSPYVYVEFCRSIMQLTASE